MTCLWCEEEIRPEDDHAVMADGTPAHKECLLRQVVGSVAHQRGECSCFGGQMEDPPFPGMTKREAARSAVNLWLSRQTKPN